MLSILQPEISTIESRIAQMQAEIASAQQRVALLAETELLAGGSLETLKTTIEKVSSLAPDAIATLRTAVLNLFSGSDDDNGNGNGNQPINPAPAPEPLNGQSYELASVLEDAPSESLQGQAVEIACIMSDAPKQPHVELIPLNHLVSYQRREDGEIICAYLAGNNKSRLKDWGSWLCNQHSVGSGFELREAKRMTAYKYELKIWGMELLQVVRLSETDTTKSVPSRYHVASIPVAEKLLAPEIEDVQHVPDREVEAVLTSVVKSELGVEPESQGFQVGDALKVISDRHGVELVGQTGIVTAGTAAGAAVNVNGTLRWFCSDEVILTEATPTPRNAADDLFPTAPAPAYNATPIGRAGAMANWKARTLGGIGVNLKDCGTGGIKTIEEWQRIEAEQKAQKALAATASTPDDEPEF